jgi:molecular chaperone GrpE
MSSRKNRDEESAERKPALSEGDDGVGATSAKAADGPAIDAEIDGLKAELGDLNAKWLRALADLDNYKKRVERDRRRWTDAAREEILLDLLDVVDNFERALACDDGTEEEGSFREGVELILKHLTDVLRKHGVTPIVTSECEFDPNLHEAVGSVDSPDHDANRIVEETQKGYMLGDKLLRCSKVLVSK